MSAETPPAGPRQRHWLLSVTDRIVLTSGHIGSWIFFVVGGCVAYEVVVRYGFNNPTHWVEEVSRLGMVWGTFLALATCLNRRQMITITVLLDRLGPRARFVQEVITFTLVAVLAAVIAWYALESMMQTISVNRRTNTVMSMPYWVFYLAIIIGFALLLLQALTDIIVMAVTGTRPRGGFGQEEI
ncbi:TRAP transporter small permease [Marinibacterium profundimaris]|uniref:TRAP transporter small permease protein n=1 Tax=Marinibacterium profundimaris TaxID=1679460 RepID=A0A225NJ95_9RHOB|nr:TRAP transporter small permease [Marinibacterium profundimaris]OWU73291.1 hypothetical protein ATO3_11355 [Marinibacterium profundimaris]